MINRLEIIAVAVWTFHQPDNGAVRIHPRDVPCMNKYFTHLFTTMVIPRMRYSPTIRNLLPAMEKNHGVKSRIKHTPFGIQQFTFYRYDDGRVAKRTVNPLYVRIIQVGKIHNGRHRVPFDHSPVPHIRIFPRQWMRIVITVIYMIMARSQSSWCIYSVIIKVGIITNTVLMPVPIRKTDTRIQVESYGITDIHRIFLEIYRIRSIILECFPENRILAKRNLIFQGNVPVHNFAIPAHFRQGVKQRHRDFTRGYLFPFSNHKTFIHKTISHMLIHQFFKQRSVPVQLHLHFHNITVRKIVCGGINKKIIHFRQLGGGNILIDSGIAVPATVHQIEIPIPGRHTVKRIVVLIIIVILICAAKLTVVEDRGAKRVTRDMVAHRDRIRETPLLNPKLHTARIQTTHRWHQSRILISARDGVQRSDIGLLIRSADHHQQMRVHNDIPTAILQQAFHTHNVNTTVDRQCVHTAHIIPAGIMGRV